MRRAAVGAHEITLRRATMLDGDRPQRLVVGRVRRPQDDADVHHDVDEQRLRSDERREIAAHLAAEGERAARIDQNVTQPRIAGEVIPAEIGREEQKAEVVHIAVKAAPLERPAIALRLLAPKRLLRVLVEQTENAGMKAFAAARTALALLAPQALNSVNRVVNRVVYSQPPALLGRKVQRLEIRLGRRHKEPVTKMMRPQRLCRRRVAAPSVAGIIFAISRRPCQACPVANWCWLALATTDISVSRHGPQRRRSGCAALLALPVVRKRNRSWSRASGVSNTAVTTAPASRR